MAGRSGRTDRLSRLNIFNYPKRKARPPSAREQATFLEVLFVTWLFPLLKVGMEREITLDDLQPTMFEDQAENIADHLEILWSEYLDSCKLKNKKPSLVRVLMKAYGKKFFFFGLFSLAEETIFRMIQVIAIGYVLDYFEGNYLTTFTGTILFGVGGIILGSVAFLISFHWSIFNMHHVCCHIRIGLSSLVYRKVLRLSQASLRGSTVGQIVTIIASDLHRFDRKHIQVNYVWVAPIHLLVVVYILYYHYHYGVTSLIGLCVLIFFTLIQYAMAKKFMSMRQKRVDSSDHRIRAVVEIINAFYTIKVHCWENFFQNKAMSNRHEEVKVLRTTMFLRLVNSAIGFVVTKLSVFMTLLMAFIWNDAGMDAKRVFVTLVLYEHVRVNSVLLFPIAVHDVAELITSCKRIEEYLLADELEIPNTTQEEIDEAIGRERPKEPMIEVSNLSCRWVKEESFALTDISFTANKGDLFVIAGPVASGKSTLISAILGEILPDEGHVMVCGRMAYVPQVPSLFPGSIKRNIVFGYGLNEKWYDQVIHMVELHVDFKHFPKGDQSLTETTRFTMAQKVRINIARALYANAEVYILDDPLQSMDLKQYRHFLDSVLRGALADKVVLLVTHHVYVLEEASQILLMYQGKIHKQGTYHELQAQGIEFFRDMEDEGEFDELKEDYVATDDLSLIVDDDDLAVDSNMVMLEQDELVPGMVKPKLAARYELINFDIDEKSKSVRRVSQGPVNIAGAHRLSMGTGRTRSILDLGNNPPVPDGAIAHMTILASDEGAYDSRDRVYSPRKISLGLYYDFLRTGSSRCTLFVLLIICILSQVIYSATDLWIENWAHAEEEHMHHARQTGTSSFRENREHHVLIYFGLVLSIVVFSFCRSVLIFVICLKASTSIFESLLKATITARLHHFERTGAGHAINRLSKDMVIIDDLIPPTLLEVLGVFFETCGALVIVCGFANPWFIIPSSLFICANMIIYRIYHLTAADLKRIEGNARTPVYAHLNRTLQGVTTIRAFGQEQAFSMIFDRLQDNHTASWYLFLSTQAWLAVTVDCISVILIGWISLSLFFFEEKKSVNPAIVGLTISKIIELSILVQFGAAELSNAETQMISVERVLEFTNPREPDPFEEFEGPEPPENWISKGQIEFIDVPLFPTQIPKSIRRRGQEYLNLKIEGGQWVGIVGKAGSGKTSLLNTLFRVANVKAGSIMIDGVDISTLGLHHLRSRISMIPQTPCMYQGTLRQNLDPLNMFEDDEIWDALKEACLYDSIKDLENGLDSHVTEFGMNFSAGQRQFVCLARAILEKNKIICCDEPTASLDGLSQIQMLNKLKEHFGQSTLLFVAHRIHSIIDCERIIVLDAGHVVEDGTPLDLLQKKEGPFHELVSHLGQGNIDELVEKIKIARKAKSGNKLKPSAKSQNIFQQVGFQEPTKEEESMKPNEGQSKDSPVATVAKTKKPVNTAPSSPSKEVLKPKATVVQKTKSKSNISRSKGKHDIRGRKTK